MSSYLRAFAGRINTQRLQVLSECPNWGVLEAIDETQEPRVGEGVPDFVSGHADANLRTAQNTLAGVRVNVLLEAVDPTLRHSIHFARDNVQSLPPDSVQRFRALRDAPSTLWLSTHKAVGDFARQHDPDAQVFYVEWAISQDDLPIRADRLHVGHALPDTLISYASPSQCSRSGIATEDEVEEHHLRPGFVILGVDPIIDRTAYPTLYSHITTAVETVATMAIVSSIKHHAMFMYGDLSTQIGDGAADYERLVAHRREKCGPDAFRVSGLKGAATRASMPSRYAIGKTNALTGLLRFEDLSEDQQAAVEGLRLECTDPECTASTDIRDVRVFSHLHPASPPDWHPVIVTGIHSRLLCTGASHCNGSLRVEPDYAQQKGVRSLSIETVRREWTAQFSCDVVAGVERLRFSQLTPAQQELARAIPWTCSKQGAGCHGRNLTSEHRLVLVRFSDGEGNRESFLLCEGHDGACRGIATPVLRAQMGLRTLAIRSPTYQDWCNQPLSDKVVVVVTRFSEMSSEDQARLRQVEFTCSNGCDVSAADVACTSAMEGLDFGKMVTGEHCQLDTSSRCDGIVFASLASMQAHGFHQLHRNTHRQHVISMRRRQERGNAAQAQGSAPGASVAVGSGRRQSTSAAIVCEVCGRTSRTPQQYSRHRASHRLVDASAFGSAPITIANASSSRGSASSSRGSASSSSSSSSSSSIRGGATGFRASSSSGRRAERAHTSIAQWLVAAGDTATARSAGTGAPIVIPDDDDDDHDYDDNDDNDDDDIDAEVATTARSSMAGVRSHQPLARVTGATTARSAGTGAPIVIPDDDDDDHDYDDNDDNDDDDIDAEVATTARSSMAGVRSHQPLARVTGATTARSAGTGAPIVIPDDDDDDHDYDDNDDDDIDAEVATTAHSSSSHSSSSSSGGGGGGSTGVPSHQPLARVTGAASAVNPARRNNKSPTFDTTRTGRTQRRRRRRRTPDVRARQGQQRSIVQWLTRADGSRQSAGNSSGDDDDDDGVSAATPPTKASKGHTTSTGW
ncbi:hypothetical protein PTSG_12392 [Salpingoeca rosetta]|uniref:Uncharacterized protein n=1 Tax=Salpingoeca rosetta (strain ATCC 50818 / BSB-021) TaxID=946362 RepID=F2UDN8_SALR5|nr:uncharacterized protein PTSG_12392 [Salpingoeca rosetta]EGD74733.1 hypothetical protein PTSG_12392 [Salpingoeca rosetta]|eukprot:XP_004992990.1 hypothetical protein PTSG_12392 [Salpingoeca rosetta]